MAPADEKNKNQQIETAELREICDRLIHWYRVNKRPIIFRDLVDPYQILVSEIMLQQTTVATATEYFGRFMLRFPNVTALAEASEDDVMAMWAGLGYYRRARLLHQASRQIVTEWAGVVPDTMEGISTLPGIGRYTAGAVLSFGYNHAAPIVEANTLRVYTRLFAIEGLVTTSLVQKHIWNIAAQLVSATLSPREFNHGIMEHGAVICQPVPRCGECVVMEFCRGFKAGLTAVIPCMPAKIPKRNVGFYCYVVQYLGKYLVRRIPPGEWHAGLFGFPSFEVGMDDLPGRILAARLGIQRDEADLPIWAELRYTVTTNKVTLKIFRLNLDDPPVQTDPNVDWKSLSHIATLPLGSAQKKLLNLLLSQDELISDIQ